MRTLSAFALLLAPLFLTAANARDSAPKGFVSLFNGKDLSGWEGNMALWSVSDGAITGRTSAEIPLKGNTFLIWKGGQTANFELRAQFRFVHAGLMRNGNSGVQYRSKVVDPAGWVVGGYQADMDAGGKYVGMLYEEKGRGIVAKPGEKVRLSAPAQGEAFKPEILGATAAPAAVSAAFKPDGWNDLVVMAEGNHLRHFINGTPTADVTDLDDSKAAKSGVLALQIHTGPPMTIQFRNVYLKALP